MIGDPNQGYYIVRYGMDTHHADSPAHKKLALCILNYSRSNLSDKNGEDHSKLMTCSTMGVFQLFENDTIYLQHTSKAKSMASFHSNASFFGFVQLGDTNYMNLLKTCKGISTKRT